MIGAPLSWDWSWLAFIAVCFVFAGAAVWVFTVAVDPVDEPVIGTLCLLVLLGILVYVIVPMLLQRLGF